MTSNLDRLGKMNAVLSHWNSLDGAAAAAVVLPCCGSRAWAAQLAARRPILDEDALLRESAAVWQGLAEEAWQEAFDSHPRIGESRAQKHATAESLVSSEKEQAVAQSADEAAKAALKDVGRALNIPLARVDHVTKLIPTRLNITLEEALAEEPALEAVTIDTAQQKISVATLGRADVEKLTAKISAKISSAQNSAA